MARSTGKGNSELAGQHWHLIGILGTGMQALARYASERGVRVTGSDVRPTPAMRELMRRGIHVRLGQDSRGFNPTPDLVVVSQAIGEDNFELREARRLGLELVTYPELLGRFMEEQPGVAVAGVHGKSTTAAMIAYVFHRAGADPSYLIGADIPQLGGSARYGRGEYFVAEACEYKRSFLYLWPRIGVITNVEPEHLDYYHGMWDIQQAFRDFASQVDAEGAIVLNADDPNALLTAEAAVCKKLKYGIDDPKAHYRAERIWRAKKHTNFDLVYKRKPRGRFSIRLYGTHNVYNALAAAAACHEAGVDFEQIRAAFADFEGPARRLQLLGEPWDVAILSDYAHHPTEIRASLAAAQQRFPKRRIFCIFEPHQFSRTRMMLPELAAAFEEAWVTLITDIYPARDSDEDRSSVSAMDLVHLMNHNGLTAHYVPEFADVEDIIVGDVVPGDVVLVMGAGNVWEIAQNIVPRVEEKGRRQIAA